MADPLAKVKEVVLIDRLRRRLRPRDKSVLVSIGDDTAVVRGPKGKYLLYTCDMLIESVHFRRGEDPARVGYKALAVSVSDIAAMAGIPKYALISVGFPRRNAGKVAEGLFAGVSRCAGKFKVDVIGGDTNRSERLVVDVFMAGEVEEENLVLRSGARPGDLLFVSGPLGGSGRGKHLDFTPRVREARFLVENFKVTSMIDLSDGLGMDAHRLARASGLGALIFESRIPKSAGVRSVENALFDGEDFELLFTLPRADAFRLFSAAKQRKGPDFFFIGRMTDLFAGVRMVTKNAKVRNVPCDGFRHF